VQATLAATELGMTTIALVGEGGRLSALAKHVVTVPSGDTQRIQEVHLFVEHMLCELVELALFGHSA
jgi:D-sedoheptulose 7-phosphate isomerase